MPTSTGAAWQTWYPQTTTQTYQQSSSVSETRYSSSSPSASVVSGTPTLPISTATSAPASATGPCASVAKLAAAYTNAQPSATATVPAQLAYECLVSIPFNQSAAEQYLDSMDPYITWQTTLEYLKSPPAEVSSHRSLPIILSALTDCAFSMLLMYSLHTTFMLHGRRSKLIPPPVPTKASMSSAGLSIELLSSLMTAISFSIRTA